MSLTETILSTIPGDIIGGLRRTDRLWQAIREDALPIPQVVKESQTPLGNIEWDVVVCGGTLGIFIASSLVQLGYRVAVIERGILRGRDQEWNISRQELDVFLELNLLTEAELQQAIATEYNPARVSFLNGPEVWVQNVLNIGIDPVFLLETLKSKFLASGGCLWENSPFVSAVVHPDGVVVECQNENSLITGSQMNQIHEKQPLTTHLLIDAMGHFSPIVQQARQGQKPEGVCLVVGSCAKGFPVNETGDLLVSFTPIKNQCQYFWEAFPARDGRTTYLFTYLDAHPSRPSLEFLYEEYLNLLPEYQNVELSQLKLELSLFGFFPSYQQSPLKMPWNRILPVGDSSGSQSPVSFGGFGAMVRHLKRLTLGIDGALKSNALSHHSLALLQPYQPNIAVTWLFQRAMSIGIDQKIAPNQINQLLSAVFQAMKELGDDVLQPFLQDVVQFRALSQTLLKTSLTQPRLILPVIPQVGIPILLDWMINYLNLGIYTAFYRNSKLITPAIKSLPPIQRYYCDRLIESWQYGSGSDY